MRRSDFTYELPEELIAQQPLAERSASRLLTLDGATGAELFSIMPYGNTFTGGAYVSLGDINGDGKADLAITPDITGGPRVRIFSGNGFGQMADFFGIDDVDFRGGARTAIGDLNHDGKGDLIVSAGFGGGPRIALFDGSQLTLAGGPKFIGDFFAFEPELRNGAYLAIGDLNGDGYGELLAGAGSGGASASSGGNTGTGGGLVAGTGGAGTAGTAGTGGTGGAGTGGGAVGSGGSQSSGGAGVPMGTGSAGGCGCNIPGGPASESALSLFAVAFWIGTRRLRGRRARVRE